MLCLHYIVDIFFYFVNVMYYLFYCIFYVVLCNSSELRSTGVALLLLTWRTNDSMFKLHIIVAMFTSANSCNSSPHHTVCMYIGEY